MKKSIAESVEISVNLTLLSLRNTVLVFEDTICRDCGGCEMSVQTGSCFMGEKGNRKNFCRKLGCRGCIWKTEYRRNVEE